MTDDIAVIREAFAAWNRGEIEYWVDHADPEVEIWSHYAVLEGSGPYRGKEGIRRWREEIDSNFELHEVFADELRPVDRGLLVLGRVRFRGRASQGEISHPFGWVCEMRGGRLTRMRFFDSHAAAIEAASESA